MARKSKLEQLVEVSQDNKLIIEVALAGLALWQMKRLHDRRSDAAKEPVPRPLVETLKDAVISVYPSSKFYQEGKPDGITISSVDGPEPSIAVSGAIDEEGNFIPVDRSDSDPSRLQILKNRIDEVRQKLEDQFSGQ